MLSKPENRLRVMAERVPQVERLAAKMIERSGPAWEWVYGAWRRLATAMVALLTLWLFLHVMFGANGMVVYRQKRAEYETLQKENDRLQQDNDTIQQQINALQNNAQTIEKEAREQLHYARPGEVVYVAPQPANAKPPNHSAKR